MQKEPVNPGFSCVFPPSPAFSDSTRFLSGLTLSELGAAADGLNAAAVGAGVRRIESRRKQDAKFCARLKGLERKLLESET